MRLTLIAFLIVWICGCGKSDPNIPSTTAAHPIDELTKQIPNNDLFGNLYTKVQPLLINEQLTQAVQSVLNWGTEHIPNFNHVACAPFEILEDSTFTQSFGSNTLAVTFPWMQVVIRDGKRIANTYLWKSPSLFVSTILHEYVHVSQRALQAQNTLQLEHSCLSSLNALFNQQEVWLLGFKLLQSNFISNLTQSQKKLLYHWTSPIERARDEVDASIQTIEWMDHFTEELNIMTLGAVNNWVYAVQYLAQLKTLSEQNCFSPDEDVFHTELNIYQVEISQFIEKLKIHEKKILLFFQKNQIHSYSFNLDALASDAKPTGRLGSRCEAQ